MDRLSDTDPITDVLTYILVGLAIALGSMIADTLLFFGSLVIAKVVMRIVG